MSHSAADHSGSAPPALRVAADLCVGCSYCRLNCPVGAVEWAQGKARITDSCNACGRCLRVCPVLAIERGGGAR